VLERYRTPPTGGVRSHSKGPKVNVKKQVMGVGALAALLTVAVAGTAPADPATPSDTALVAVGSDTTQDVMDGLAAAINGGTTIFNYKATGTTTISTRTAAIAACQNFHRPNGSGDGKNALQSAVGNQAVGTNYPTPLRSGSTLCADIARSSSSSFPAAPAGATGQAYRRYEFAVDSVTFAVSQVGQVPKKISLGDLKRFYTANGTPGSAGTAGCLGKRPLIPQALSGTRAFWASVLGITDTLLSDPTVGTAGHWGTCVRDTTDGVVGSTSIIEEHNGIALGLDGKAIVPFSVAQWISQQGGIAASDVRGNASLGSIDWSDTTGSTTTNPSAPMLLSSSNGSGTRTVYNFVAKDAAVSGNTAGTGVPFNATIASTFGVGGSVCANSAVIQRYGFGIDANCGQFVDGP
jgi:ABC-type phosphate transport system substrate-binding protein